MNDKISLREYLYCICNGDDVVDDDVVDDDDDALIVILELYYSNH